MQRKQRFATNDLYKPSINMSLGQDYVEHLAEVFDGNLIKMIAAYNAGPGRVNEWLRLNGDPRTGAVDWVTWIEQIPSNFETRYYVMRVIENMQVYRSRLADDVATPLLIEDDLNAGSTGN